VKPRTNGDIFRSVLLRQETKIEFEAQQGMLWRNKKIKKNCQASLVKLTEREPNFSQGSWTAASMTTERRRKE
jgi:hypothetical protein